MADVHPDAVLEQTLQVLQNRTIDITTGTDIIQDWIAILTHTDGVEPVTMSLQNLYNALKDPSSNTVQIRTLLDELAQYTASYARHAEGRYAASLHQLAEQLNAFSVDTNKP